MSKKTFWILPLGSLALLLPVASVSARQVDDSEQMERSDENREFGRRRGRRGGNRGPDRIRTRERVNLTPRQMAEKLESLKTAMWEKMDLSDEQKITLDELFQEQMESIKTDEREVQKIGRDKHREGGQEIRDLQRDLARARREGDDDRARELRARLGELMQQRSPRGGDQGLRAFLREAGEVLTEEQRSQFREVLQDVGLGRQRGPRGGGAFMLIRFALRSEEVDATPEVQKAAMELMRSYRDEAGDEPLSPEERAERDAQLEEDVLDLLDEETQPKFIAKMEELRKNPPEFERRGRRGSRGDRPDRPKRGERDVERP